MLLLSIMLMLFGALMLYSAVMGTDIAETVREWAMKP